MELLLPVLLLVVGIIAIIIELFVPAGGILGIFGIGLSISSVVVAYVKMGTGVGSVFLIIAVITLPILMGLTFKIFPKTFMGKLLILKNSEKTEEGYESHESDNYKDLIDQTGTSLTPLRPTGLAKINNVKYNVISSGEYIEQNCLIQVIKVEGNKITVRKTV